MKHVISLSTLTFIVAIIACKKDDISDNTNTTTATFDDTPYSLYTGDLEPPQIAADNKLTEQGVLLGKMLFYDGALSKDGTQSCASCHRQEHAFSDTNQFSTGVEGLQGKRQAMAIFNMAWNTNGFFWDGRAHLLRDQATKPIQDPLEMNESIENVITKLSAQDRYLDQFIRAFGTNEITEERIALALEQFMNSIVSVDSKYDRFLRGELSLSPSEERGRELFFAEFNPAFPDISGADCAHCHTGKTFENDQYMNNALDTDAEMQDSGRASVSGLASDMGKFKVTSLRNVAVTPPYMHDGRFKTLREVVEHYNSGLKNSSTIDPTLIYPLNEGGLQLSNQDIDDLVAFLKTLTDEVLLSNPEFGIPPPI